jgi:hypothetical protein
VAIDRLWGENQKKMDEQTDEVGRFLSEWKKTHEKGWIEFSDRIRTHAFGKIGSSSELSIIKFC